MIAARALIILKYSYYTRLYRIWGTSFSGDFLIVFLTRQSAMKSTCHERQHVMRDHSSWATTCLWVTPWPVSDHLAWATISHEGLHWTLAAKVSYLPLKWVAHTTLRMLENDVHAKVLQWVTISYRLTDHMKASTISFYLIFATTFDHKTSKVIYQPSAQRSKLWWPVRSDKVSWSLHVWPHKNTKRWPRNQQ